MRFLCRCKEERKASAWYFSRCHYSSEAKPGVVEGRGIVGRLRWRLTRRDTEISGWSTSEDETQRVAVDVVVAVVVVASS